MSVVSAASSGRQSFSQQSYTGLKRAGIRGKGRTIAAAAAVPSRSSRAAPPPPKVSAVRRSTRSHRRNYEDEQDDWSSTSSDSSRPCKRGKDWYDWNKCLPPSCYPSTVSIPISGYGYYPTTYYSYSMPYPYVPALPYLNMPYPNPYSAYSPYSSIGGCNPYFPGVPAATTVNTLTDTVCGTQGCTTISQPVVTSCNPFGCSSTYGPPNLASISDTIFKRNLFLN
jgi:hypothetical protein